MAEEMKKSNASSILANDTAPKKAAGEKVQDKSSGMKPKHDTNAHAGNKPAAGGRKHKHTHIEHHENGTHTVRHTPVGGGDDVSYAAQDLDGVHDGLEHHVGEPNGDEGAAPQEADAAAGGQSEPEPQPQPQAQPQAV